MELKIKTSDLLAGLILIGVGAFIVYKSLRLDYVNEFGPGPGFLPLWLGIAVLVLAGVMVAMSLKGADKETTGEISWGATLRGLTTWFAFIVAILLVNRLGFILSFVLLTFFLAWVINRRSPLVSLTAAVSCGVAFYIVFSRSLGLALPQGPLGF